MERMQNVLPKVKAGVYPPELRAACLAQGIEPDSLKDWAVKRREVVLILPGGQKVSAEVAGEWRSQRGGKA